MQGHEQGPREGQAGVPGGCLEGASAGSRCRVSSGGCGKPFPHLLSATAEGARGCSPQWPRRGGWPAQIAAFHRRRRPGVGTHHAVSREHRLHGGGGGHDTTAHTAAAPTSLCASPAPACAHPAPAGRARPLICPPAAGGPSGVLSDSRERLPGTIRAPGREKRTAVTAAAPAGSVTSSCQSPCS